MSYIDHRFQFPRGENMSYSIDFFKNLFHKKNYGIIIYLILNIFVISYLFTFNTQDGQPVYVGVVFAILLYFISVVIALSPIGEWILRLQTGSKALKRREHLDRLMPLFNDVYGKAVALYPAISKNIKLYINEEESYNAFATGRNTITINRGLLQCSDDQIKAVLAHEFAHLAHKDTDLLLLITVGNFIVNAVFLFIRAVAFVVGIAVSIANESIGGVITTFLIDIVLGLMMRLWTKVGVLLVLHSNRNQEFIADKFAYELGFGNDLAFVIDNYRSQPSKGPWAALMSSGPSIDDRIAKLQDLGSTYRNHN